MIVPAVAKLREEQAKRLGVEKLKYYDETCIFPDGNADPVGGESVLVPIAQKMYREISPETGEFFRITSYNVCYTKLLRISSPTLASATPPGSTSALRTVVATSPKLSMSS